MTRRSPLPRPVVWLLRAVVPIRTVDTVLTDLEDEWLAVRTSQPRIRAVRWLVGEASSLIVAFAAASWRPASLKGLGSMWIRDLRLVIRGMRRSPLASAAAAGILSSGLLAVAISSGLASALFRPVSTLRGNALHRIVSIDRRGATTHNFSFIELEAMRERLAGTARVAAVNLQPVLIRAAGVDRQTTGEVVDGEYFGTIGARILIGRGLGPADDRPGSPRVAVVSEPLWRNRFHASPDAVGAQVLLNGASYAIVGVAGPSASSSIFATSVDAWIPIAHADPMLGRRWRTDIANRWFNVFVLPEANGAEMDGRLAAVAADLAAVHPDRWRDRRLRTAPATVIVGRQRALAQTLTAILGALSVLILAVAAANVGGLLLSRAAVNRHHAAIHLALGSGRAAIARRLTIEGGLLGVLGGLLALGMYARARTWFAEITLLPTLALRLDLPLDARIAGLVFGAAAASGLLLAAGPALWASRMNLSGLLREGGDRTGAGRSVTRARQVLVSAQVCFSLALIVSAALFMRSLNALNRVDLGFPRDGLVAMDFDVEPTEAAAADMPLLAREALARVAGIPGIAAAAMSNRAPVDPSTPAVDVTAGPGRPIAGDVTVYLATAGYFDTVALPLAAGRSFTHAEAESSARVVIVNEALASRLWPPGDALDRELHIPAEGGSLRVVGVARNSKYRSLSEADRPHLYRPTPAGLGLTLLARTRGDAHEALGSMQRVLDRVGPGLVGFFPRTLDDHLVIETLPSRVVARTATAVGTLALLMSTVGLYGLVAWFVELRRREIGVRMALGASVRDVRRLVVRQALTTAVPGMAAGLAVAVALGMTGQSVLFGVQPLDPLSLAAGVIALAAVVVAASYVPVRRATRVDPALVLKQ